MITVCPSCQRQFRIYAPQLSAAKGLVQCGFCGEQFNALDRLSDLPLSAQNPARQKNPGTDRPEEPEFEIPGAVVLVNDEKIGNKRQTATLANQYTKATQDKEEYFGLGLGPEPKPVSRIATVIWSLGVFLLLIVIMGQLAWFNRDQLLNRYPEYVPMVKQLCERWQCELVRERDLASIILVNRDVRDHPRYNNALLVNITIENQSELTQPYPGILFTLFDNNGAITGYRRLQASEYLDPEISIDKGFTPHMPLHLVLEVADTIKSTVGFEFGFF